MRLPELQRILIDAARRQEPAAVSATTPRTGARTALIAAIAIILIGGTAAGAVITLGRSKPLSGTLADGPSLRGASRYRISVFPYMTVGWSGWCASAVFDSPSSREATDYGCGAVESGGPAISGGGSFGDQSGEYSYGVVSDSVASVHWDGKVVLPIKNPRLPPRTRAYFIVGPARNLSPRLPKLFDASGREIPNPLISRETAVEHLPEITVDPRSPGKTPCALRASNVPGLVPLSQTVTTPVPWPRRQPGAFLACTNALYELDGTIFGVAVLLDASNPQRLAPPLPELQSDPAHPWLLTGRELGNIGFPQGSGVFNGAGGRAFNTTTRQQEFANHDISARRAGPAWIIAESGTPGQRATLLANLAIGR